MISVTDERQLSQSESSTTSDVLLLRASLPLLESALNIFGRAITTRDNPITNLMRCEQFGRYRQGPMRVSAEEESASQPKGQVWY